MKHVTSLMSKKHMLLTLLMLLCSMRVAMAANQIITINVATPGTLNTMMGETKKYSITALKLTGSINIDDIKFLREMAGCYHNWGKYPGKLEYLDLENVRLNFETWSSLDIYTNKRNYWATVTGKDAQTLPDYIFAYLDQLKTIILPSGIRNIGNSVFYRNTSLTTVKLPYNLRSIGEFAFSECENLTDLTIPTFVEKIGEYAFSGCSSLTSIKIPSGVKTIEESTFENCSNLTTVSLPSSLTNVYNKAFQNDEKLENIEFPSSIEYIGSYAFAGCSSLRTNYIGGNIKWIAGGAFKDCTGIQTMVIDPTDGGIDIAGFEGCTNLESVTINNIVNNISAAAFKGCSKLRSFTVEGYGNKLAIGKSAFEGCSSLKQFDFPDIDTTIGDRAFYGCSEFKYIHLSWCTTAIGASAFAQCTHLACIFADMFNPIKIDQNVFEGVNKIACALFVPEGRYQPYWLADVWGDFANIVDNNNGMVYNEMFNITVKTPGTLKHLLGSMKDHISRLTLSGTLNIWDVQCLREMAGCYYNANGGKYNGTLIDINLQKATFDICLGSSRCLIYGPNGEEEYMYIEDHDDTVITNALFAYLDALHTVTLPENGAISSFKTFMHCPELRFAIIPEGVKTIGPLTFEGCYNLQLVQTPSTLNLIDALAFKGCSDLKDVILSPRLRTIGHESFSGCSSLTLLKLPESVTTILHGAYEGCSGLKTLTLPANLETIQDEAFKDCTGLTHIEANMKSPVTIMENTFANVPCDKCTLIVPEGSAKAYKEAAVWNKFCPITEKMSSGVTVVVDQAGTLSTKISSKDKENISRLKVIGPINIDDIQFLREMAGCWFEERDKRSYGSLSHLDLDAARLVGSDKSINIYIQGWWNDPTNRLVNTAKIEPNGNEFSHLFSQVTRLSSVVMPSYVTTTGHGTFIGSPIRSVFMSENVTTIGESCFSECEDLTSINLPASVKNIDVRAFNGCSKLAAIGLPAGLTTMGKGAFQGCGFTQVVVPDGITTISDGLFANCSKLTSITLPKGLKTIEDGAFMGCGFTEFVVPDGITTISNNLFAYCGNLTSITLPKDMKAIGTGAFMGCGFTDFVIPDAITTISDNLFAYCPNLQNITFPKTITSMGNGIFSHSGIGNFTLPKQITEITNNMFEGCQNLTHIYLHDGLKSIGDYAFQDCNSLGGITLPNSVTKIGKGCFSHCEYLKEGVTLSDAITEIPEEAFAYCGYLHEIKLPAELKRIGYRAFCGSPYIGSFGGLKIPSKVTEIAPEAFYKSFQDIEVLELPACLKTVGDYAFADCSAKVIYAYMSEPFPLKDADFYSRPRSECKLYVPKGCAKKYRQAEIWKEFDIEEMDGTGIEGVINDSTVTEEARYDANGNRLAAPTKGLNIVRYSDGTVKKVMVE